MADGTGLKKIYPSLKNNSKVWNGSLNLPCLIREGHKGNILSADMPAFAKLTVAEISNIVNFLHHSMNDQKTVSFSAIKSQLNECEQRK